MRSWIVLVLAVAACQAPGIGSPSDWGIVGGGKLGSIYAENDTGVVLLLDPAQCFSCTSLLGQWLDWETEHPTRFHLLLSRTPLSWENTRLAPLPVRDVLAMDVEARILPIELVFSGSKLLYRSPPLRGISNSPLLSALRTTTLDRAVLDLLSFPTHEQIESNTPESGPSATARHSP